MILLINLYLRSVTAPIRFQLIVLFFFFENLQSSCIDLAFTNYPQYLLCIYRIDIFHSIHMAKFITRADETKNRWNEIDESPTKGWLHFNSSSFMGR